MIGLKIFLTSTVLIVIFTLFAKAAKTEPVSPLGMVRTFLTCWLLSLIGMVIGLVAWIWGL